MDSQTTSLQLLTSSNVLNPVPDAKTLADIRMDKRVPRYKDLQPSVRVGWLTKQISAIYAIKHIGMVDANGRSRVDLIKTDAMALDALIIRNRIISDFTQPEISDAFLAGLSGDYGEYVGVTAESLFKFLRGFRDSDKKAEATAIVRKRNEEASRAADEERRRKIREEIEEAKRNGTFKRTWDGLSTKFVKKVTEEESRAHREKIREQIRMVKAGLI